MRLGTCTLNERASATTTTPNSGLSPTTHQKLIIRQGTEATSLEKQTPQKTHLHIATPQRSQQKRCLIPPSLSFRAYFKCPIFPEAFYDPGYDLLSSRVHSICLEPLSPCSVPFYPQSDLLLGGQDPVSGISTSSSLPLTHGLKNIILMNFCIYSSR